MKKLLSLFCCVPFLLSLTACALLPPAVDGGDGDEPSTPVAPEQPENPEKPEPPEDPVVKENNYLRDVLFENGFRLSKLDEGAAEYHDTALATLNKGATPVWSAAQWSSKYDLLGGTHSGGFGEYTFEYDGTNPSAKALSVNVKTGDISLTLNAEAEYETDRKEGEPWPCILIEQSWFGGDLIRVADLSELTMRMDYTVTKLEDKMHGAPHAGLHCAQLVWYVTLQNRNLDSPDYGKYIWFGLCLYDNRLAGTVSALYAAEDGGKEENTGAFIYQPSSSDWSPTGRVANVKEKMQIRFDLRKAAKEAYDLAIARNYLGGTKFEDLYIGSTNFGFEVTGTYNVSADISNLGIIWQQNKTLLPEQNAG